MSNETAKVTLVLVPPGSRGRIARLLVDFMKDAAVYNVEARIREKLGLDNFHLVLSKHDKYFVQGLWKEMISEIVADFAHTGKTHLVLISHSVYYSNLRREYYSAVHSNYLSSAIKSESIEADYKVILVIDDIMDIFESLRSSEDDLFGKFHISKFVSDFREKNPIPLDDAAHLKISLNWYIYCMMLILSWRSQEVILAQTIADALSMEGRIARLMIWGTKQDPLSLVEWTNGSNTDLLYISHPITEYRNHQKRDGAWPEMVHAINQLQTSLAEIKVCTVMPTAIDEFRFQRVDNKYTAQLTDRWPVPDPVRKALSSYDVAKGDVDHHMLMSPGKIDLSTYAIDKSGAHQLNALQDYIDAAFSILEGSISSQLANRDHLIVSLTDGIIAVEPWSEKKGGTHSGMRKEIEYLNTMFKQTKKQSEISHASFKAKKICVIFLASSIRTFLKDTSFRIQATSEIKAKIDYRHPYMASVNIKDFLNDKLDLDMQKIQSDPDGSLGPDAEASLIKKEVLPAYQGYKTKAVARLFINNTMFVDKDKLGNNLSVIIVEKPSDMLSTENLEKIRKFFVEGVLDSSWEKALTELF